MCTAFSAIGADLPGAVGANIPISKWSMGECTQRKNCQKHRLEKCIHCGQMISRKISKTGATRCQILRLKCTKLDFRCGSLQRSARPLAVFKGPTSKEREGESGEGKERERDGRREEGRGGTEGKEKEGREERWMEACTAIGIFESRRLCLLPTTRKS